MKYSPRFTHAAEIDYYESLAWYEERQSGLGIQFEEIIDQIVRRIAEEPQQFRETRIRVESHMLRRNRCSAISFRDFFHHP